MSDQPQSQLQLLGQWHELVRSVALDASVHLVQRRALCQALCDSTFRDAVLIDIVRPTSKTTLAQEFLRGQHTCAQGLDQGVRSTSWARASRRGLTVLFRSAKNQRQSSEILTMLGWHAWWLGDRRVATAYIGRALQTSPPPRLAKLMSVILAVGMPPPWCRRLPRGVADAMVAGASVA